MIKRNYEIWQDIMEAPGYQVSNFGRIKSLSRWTTKKGIKGRRNIGTTILKPGKDCDCYLQVSIRFKNKKTTIKIHSLVLTHFGPSKPSPKHECNHKDGDKDNNWWTNLEWMTSQENTQHAKENGLIPVGENHHGSKFTEKQVLEIRNLYIPYKMGMQKLAKKYGVTRAAIRGIITKRVWRHI